MEIKKAEKLLIKFINKEASKEELDELTVWLKEPKNIDLFNNYVKTNYSIDFALQKFNVQKVKLALKIAKRKEERLIRKKRNKMLYRYAAAAVVIGLLFSGYLFRTDFFQIYEYNDYENNAQNKDNIQIGTDKAILTLEDGSNIALEKGRNFKTKNIESTGEKLVYNKLKANKVLKTVYNSLTIPRGGQFFLELSDGTKVWLNSESKLKYPVNFIEGKAREIELVYGEAYFDVSPSKYNKGTRFKVKSEFQSVNIIGTEFNIKAYNTENEIITTLVEGKVEIEKNNNHLFLSPNQQSILHKDNDLIDVKNVNAAHEVSWINGLYTFDETTLAEIMRTLSRWYDFEVDFKNAEQQNYVFTGVLERTKSIRDVLKNLEATGEIDFEIKENIIIIK